MELRDIVLSKLKKNREEKKVIDAAFLSALSNLPKNPTREEKLPVLPNFGKSLMIDSQFIILCDILKEANEDLSKLLTEDDFNMIQLYNDILPKVENGEVITSETLKDFMNGKKTQ